MSAAHGEREEVLAMIERTYKCDLCRDTHQPEELFGLHYSDVKKGWINATPMSVEHHLCARCISSIQKMESVCGQGYVCGGGPTCSSDHK